MSSPIVLLHGFGQDHRCWGPLRRALEAEHDVTALDLPGHGGAAAIEADLWTTADLVAASIESPATVVGYSLGGRVALHVALAHPEVVERLVLVSATAGIDDDAEREARRLDDESLAARIERDGVGAFVEGWLALPLFARLPSDGRFEEERRSNSAAGLASSLRRAGTGTQEPLWDRLGEIEVPALVVAGQQDTKFRRLAERLAAGIGPGARLAVVGEAGHSVHLEQPVVTAELVTAWLRATAADVQR